MRCFIEIYTKGIYFALRICLFSAENGGIEGLCKFSCVPTKLLLAPYEVHVCELLS